jgi:hypothetical protein
MTQTVQIPSPSHRHQILHTLQKSAQTWTTSVYAEHKLCAAAGTEALLHAAAEHPSFRGRKGAPPHASCPTPFTTHTWCGALHQRAVSITNAAQPCNAWVHCAYPAPSPMYANFAPVCPNIAAVSCRPCSNRCSPFLWAPPPGGLVGAARCSHGDTTRSLHRTTWPAVRPRRHSPQ